MRKLNEILSQRSATATTADAGASSSTDAASPDEPAVCPQCGGSGFVRHAVPVDHPDFGKALPCRCVLDETEAGRFDRLRRYSNLGDLTRHRFDTLVRRGRSAAPEHQQRFAHAVATAEAFADAAEGWLVFCGPSGSGKTHLVAALAHRLIERGQPVLFTFVPDLLDHLRAAYAPGAELPYDRLFDQVRNAPVLVLDDLGVQSPTAWANEKLFQLINHRYNTGAPTIVTTAQPLERLDERLRARLGDERLARIITLEGGAAAARYEDDGLDQPLLRSMTFESFDTRNLSLPADDQRLLENAYRRALEFSKDPQDWLVFYGPPGTGKTHLAVAIANACRKSGRAVLFQVVPDLLDHLRHSFRPESTVAYDELFERLRTVPLLVLDDFGAHASSPWAEEKLYQIVNYRYNARLPTVVTTSRPLHSMESAEERVMARFNDAKIVSMVPLPVTRAWAARDGERERREPRGRGRSSASRRQT